MANYWQSEIPQVATTRKNVIRYFQNAGKLQISNPNWTNDNGEEKPGKTITIDLTALRANPDALELVRRAIEE